MERLKAVIDFSPYNRDELLTIAQAIKTGMTASAAIYPSPPVGMVPLATQITNYQTKLAARASRATADINAFNVARGLLENDLALNGGYVNITGNGDPTSIIASGYPYYSTARQADPNPPGAPADLRLRHGEMSGVIVGRCKPQRSPSMNELWTCIGDPNTEANWQRAGNFGGGRFERGGFTPGTTVWFRVRTLSATGDPGAWSDPAMIMIM